jgi:hypothetical protein
MGADNESALLVDLEARIATSDQEGLRARWASGREQLTLKRGKQLPRGVLKTLTAELKVSRSELSARMKFADLYPGEEELSNVIGKFRTWFAITQHALTVTSRVQKAVDADADAHDHDDGEQDRSPPATCAPSLRF